MSGVLRPLLTRTLHDALLAARAAGAATLDCSLDLGLSATMVAIGAQAWSWHAQHYPYAEVCRERTVYHWSGDGFEPVARYGTALYKLVPSTWGPPTFEIDGIKMLPTARVSPCVDARAKVALIEPRGKIILDTCAGLGYFAGCCLRAGAARVVSYEKAPEVLWLRSLNPWSPDSRWSRQDCSALRLAQADITSAIVQLAAASVDAVLHDPPRFGIAGELYSQVFYEQLARVIRARGRMFHYTGTPNKLSRGRNLPQEVSRRLQRAGFATELSADGVLAQKRQ